MRKYFLIITFLLTIIILILTNGCSNKVSEELIYETSDVFKTGVVVDPYISQCKVYADIDKDGVYSQNDVLSTWSDNKGIFYFTEPIPENIFLSVFKEESGKHLFKTNNLILTSNTEYFKNSNKVVLSPMTTLRKYLEEDEIIALFSENGISIDFKSIYLDPLHDLIELDNSLNWDNEIFKNIKANISAGFYINHLKNNDIELNKENLLLKDNSVFIANNNKIISSILNKENFVYNYDKIRDQIKDKLMVSPEATTFVEGIYFDFHDMVNGTYLYNKILIEENYSGNPNIQFDKDIFYGICFYAYIKSKNREVENNPYLVELLKSMEYRINSEIITGEKVLKSNTISILNDSINIENNDIALSQVYINGSSENIIFNFDLETHEKDNVKVKIEYSKDRSNWNEITVLDFFEDLKNNKYVLNKETLTEKNETFYFKLTPYLDNNSGTSVIIEKNIRNTFNNIPVINHLSLIQNNMIMVLDLNYTDLDMDNCSYKLLWKKIDEEIYKVAKYDYNKTLSPGNNEIIWDNYPLIKDNLNDIDIKLQIDDGFSTALYEISGIQILNNNSPEINIISTEGSKGNININIFLNDKDNEKMNLYAEYSLDLGTSWKEASLFKEYNDLNIGTYEIIWESEKDIKDSINARFRIKANDGEEDSDNSIVDIFIDNNSIRNIYLSQNPLNKLKSFRSDDGTEHVFFIESNPNLWFKDDVYYINIKDGTVSEKEFICNISRFEDNDGYDMYYYDIAYVQNYPVICLNVDSDLLIYHRKYDRWEGNTVQGIDGGKESAGFTVISGKACSMTSIDDYVYLACELSIDEDGVKRYVVSGIYNFLGKEWIGEFGARKIHTLLDNQVIRKTDIKINSYNEPVLLYCVSEKNDSSLLECYLTNLDNSLLHNNLLDSSCYDAVNRLDRQGFITAVVKKNDSSLYKYSVFSEIAQLISVHGDVYFGDLSFDNFNNDQISYFYNSFTELYISFKENDKQYNIDLASRYTSLTRFISKGNIIVDEFDNRTLYYIYEESGDYKIDCLEIK